jgi:hypothetical protein
MDADHSVAATFAPRPSFSDVPPGSPAYDYVTQLAGRGIIRGYNADECAARGLAAPCFGPDDPILSAQVAALIVRSFGWEGDTAMATDLQNLNPAATGAAGNISYAQGGHRRCGILHDAVHGRL